MLPGPVTLRWRKIPEGLNPEAPVASAAGFFLYTRQMTNTRVKAFIDGYNLYHGVDEMIRMGPGPARHHLKWVNLWNLVRAFTAPSREDLLKVYYFSAYATWKPDACIRHRAYVKALESAGVTVILGKFNEKDCQCRNCGARWISHEEKATDVNIALRLLDEAVSGNFDRAIVLTADADLKPAVRLVRDKNPALLITALLPSTRYRAAHEMKSVCHSASRFEERHLAANLFPDQILLGMGQRCLALRNTHLLLAEPCRRPGRTLCAPTAGPAPASRALPSLAT